MQTAGVSGVDAEALRLIESGEYRILSLDVFDTTVWRTFPVPTDLFYALGAILREQGLLFPSTSVAAFAAERTEAERDARSQKENGEVTLSEIYASFPKGLLRPGKLIEVLKAELELERQSTHADPAIVALIERAMALGMRVAFVSDTYFDESYLRTILPSEADYLLASSTLGRNKIQGLHSELIRIASVRPSEILHIGDSKDADVKAPANLGIKSLWRPRFPELYREALASEFPSGRSDRAALFSSRFGDGGVHAIRAQSVTHAENWPDAYRAWGSLFLGPLIGGFGKWVSERCHAEGIGTTLCFMREGRILRKVLSHTGPHLISAEFFTSRYAMIRASIFRADVGELTHYLARPQPTQAKDLLGPLGIEPIEIGLNPATLICSGVARQIAERLVARTTLKKRIVDASASARKNFVHYLKTHFPELPNRVAVVDLGYSGTIQNHLQAIFDHEGIGCRTHGLYFVTGTGVRKLHAQGLAAEGFMGDNGQPLSIAHSFMRSPELIEQCLMCDEGSTLDYSDEGRPVLGIQHLPSEQLQQIEKVQTGLLDYISRFCAQPACDAVSASELKPILEAILIRALTRPTPLELKLFGGWVHDENLGSDRTRKLIETTLDADYLSHATAHQLASLSSSVSYWIFGAARAQNPLVGEAVRSIFLRKTPPEVFQCPEQELTMQFFWNDGTAHRAEAKYTLSSRRTAWSRFTIEVRNSNLLELGFSLGQPGDVISITGIILRLHPAGQDVEIIRLPLDHLESFGMEHLPGTTAAYLVKEIAGFATTVPSVRDFNGQVEVDLLFSQLPTGELCPS